MIKIKPSKAVQIGTGIDFKLLEKIINSFLEFKSSVTFKCHKNSKPFSEIIFLKNIIRLYVSETNDLKYYITTLLHEIRHFIQYQKYKKVLTYRYNNYTEYYNSPEERDARKFETIGIEVCKIYTAYKAIEEKYKKYEFNDLKELRDNYKK